MASPASVSQGYAFYISMFHLHTLSSVSSPVVSDPASNEEVVGLNWCEITLSYPLYWRSNVCRLLRVLQPPAPRGRLPPRNDPKPEQVESVTPVRHLKPETPNGTRSLATENGENKFPSNMKWAEHVPQKQRTIRTRSLATENKQNTFPGNRERSEHKEQNTFPSNGERKDGSLTAAQPTSPTSFPSLMSTTGSQLMVEFPVPTLNDASHGHLSFSYT
ncbi:hypothetical protein Bbelb_341490 [Branchiostoma belcheri]|nr:hypothetical protein Bbelb_341490 [Branchiostoma belcheri]